MTAISRFVSLLFGLVVTVAPASLHAAAPNLLAEAASFAQGKTYKLTPSAQDRAAGKYDCTTFVQAVLDRKGYAVGGETGQRINIVLSDADKAQLPTLVNAKDKKIKGVVQALVDSQQGTEVASLTQVAPGDIVQMWRLGSGTSARGHTGFVKSVDVAQKRLLLVGAHNAIDGVGEKIFTMGPGDWSVAFFVRPSR